MNKTRNIILMSAIVVSFCAIMAVIDGVLHVNYALKSAIKFVLFLILPIVYSIRDKKLNIKSLFIADKKGICRPAITLGIIVYAVIMGAYLLLKDVFDFSSITKSLTSDIGVNKNNFVFVALYISFINSLLEEYFFRGFAFLTLKRISNRRFAYLFSSLSFSLYHIAMMTGWFSIWIFAIVLIGLFIGGMLFNYLNEKTNTIYPSWFVHMFANFAINTIGFILFGII